MNRLLLHHLLSLWLVLFAVAAAVHAAETGSGMVEGRVYNPANGEYLETVRVTVEGTAIEEFTDSDGRYRLHGVPAGTARVKAFFTGLVPQTLPVVVVTGQVVQQDFNLTRAGAPTGDSTVKMDALVIATSKEMDGAAIAINEQRFAPNIKSVVSTDEFGHIAEGNIGEFMKYLPGVSIEYGGGYARGISLNGVPPAYVPITIDGFNLASTGGDNNTGRAAQVDMASINNIARIEVSFSPTPESQGSALAGTVNMVPRSAFERARPIFKNGDFAGFVPKSANLGVSLTRPKYNLRVNWNYASRQRVNAIAAGPGIAPGTFTWNSERLYLDVSGEYTLTRNFTLVANLRNVTGVYDDVVLEGLNTPPVAQLRSRFDLGSLWTFGVKARF